MEQTAVAEIWSRFGQLSDSVIRSVEIRTEQTPRSVVVELDAQEPPNSDGPWHRLRFEFIDAKEWRFEQTRADMLVVFEARLDHVEALVCVSFDAATMPDAPSIDDFRRTVAFVAASEVEVSLRPLWVSS